MAGKIRNYLLEELWIGYSWVEKAFLFSMLALQIVIFTIQPDSVLGIISGISGVISVVLCAKGKISFYYIGFVQTISYLILSWQNRFYGEVAENIFYLITMIMGVVMWQKKMVENEDGTKQVETKKFTLIQWLLSAVSTIILTIGLGYLLGSINSAQPFTDAATNVLAIFAQILMIRRYREQWLWWLIIDVLCIKLWWVAGNWSMVAMYVAWTINCVYGWYNWTKLNHAQEDDNKNEIRRQT